MMLKIMTKILNFRLVAMQEFQNIKTFLLAAAFQIGLKKFLLLRTQKQGNVNIY